MARTRAATAKDAREAIAVIRQSKPTTEGEQIVRAVGAAIKRAKASGVLAAPTGWTKCSDCGAHVLDGNHYMIPDCH